MWFKMIKMWEQSATQETRTGQVGHTQFWLFISSFCRRIEQVNWSTTWRLSVEKRQFCGRFSSCCSFFGKTNTVQWKVFNESFQRKISIWAISARATWWSRPRSHTWPVKAVLEFRTRNGFLANRKELFLVEKIAEEGCSLYHVNSTW